MRPERYSASTITALLRRKTIATMPELMTALGTPVERTVFRKLSEVPYRASYSHGGRFYTLDELARFDLLGLWSYRSVWFSAHGSLVDTAAALVDASAGGYFVDELDAALHVRTKDCLRHLVGRGRLARESFGSRHLYCSADTARGRTQMAARRARTNSLFASPVTGAVPDELKATIVLFLGLLDEKQRRLFAGLESLKVGRGGDLLVAEALGLDPATVAKGRHQLLDNNLDTERIRKPGGGRKALEKKRPRSSRASQNS
jgi:hypothetical protein